MVCAAAVALGIRFLLAPWQATLAYGVAAGNLRALTDIWASTGARALAAGAVV